MWLAFWSWVLVVGLELFMLLPGIWRLHRYLAYGSVFGIGFATGALLAWHVHLFSVLIAIVALYRIVNQLRLIKGRMQETYLRRAVRRTALSLSALQLVLAGAWTMWQYWHTDGQTTWLIATGVQFFIAVILLGATLRRLTHTAWPSRTKRFADSELPTLTVAIPARNETEDLEQCLQTVIASDYPKLEVLVLDDCSQTKQTPEIIKSFAHDGVRFVQGEPPLDAWLPKTQAYARLTEQANGEYILFCGADVRFTRGSLREVITIMLSKQKHMVSILPLRTVRDNALVQAMRYFWELVPPRRLFRRPPVLSSCWVIRKEALQKAGGFRAVSRSIVPEAHFARQLAAVDGYSFMRAGAVLPGITSVKSGNDQRETAIRMRYPQLHRRPENVAVGAAAALFFLVVPFILALCGYWIPIGLDAQLLAILTSGVLVLTYELMGLSTRVTTLPAGLVAMPAMVLYDAVITHISMWLYEFSVVEWKGRNICIPTMHVIPRLPKI
jgi:hypothetical protein